jgi:hypothetical protein
VVVEVRVLLLETEEAGLCGAGERARSFTLGLPPVVEPVVLVQSEQFLAAASYSVPLLNEAVHTARAEVELLVPVVAEPLVSEVTGGSDVVSSPVGLKQAAHSAPSVPASMRPPSSKGDLLEQGGA